MLGFALSADGSTVYAGSTAAGLLVADAATLTFRQVSTIHVQCLTVRGPDLWACSDEPSGFIAGQSKTGGAAFVPVLPNLLDIRSPLSCPPDAGAAICRSFDYGATPPYDPFTALCTSINACLQSEPLPPLAAACVDAGACGATAADGGSASTTPGTGSCGCSSVNGGGAAGGALTVGLLAVAALRRGRAAS
jgi:hypothetical protein